MANTQNWQQKVGIKYIKGVQQKIGRGNWDTVIDRTEGAVSYVPEAVANELVRTGVAVRLKKSE